MSSSVPVQGYRNKLRASSVSSRRSSKWQSGGGASLSARNGYNAHVAGAGPIGVSASMPHHSSRESGASCDPPLRRAPKRRSSFGGMASAAGDGSQLHIGSAPEAAVRVAARIRPKLSSELMEAEGVEAPEDGQHIVLTNGRERRKYTVDQVFDSRSEQGSQALFFEAFGRDMLNSSLRDHYNLCVIAYGHTGSGKTFTMMGDGISSLTEMDERALDSVGLLPRFLLEVFEAKARDAHRRWLCSCEFYELYNEQI